MLIPYILSVYDDSSSNHAPLTYRNLLEHLVDVGEYSAVQVSVIVGDKAVSEAALRHLNDGVLDGVELALNLRVVFREV